MNEINFETATASLRPELVERTAGIDAEGFPEFLLHDPVWDRGWARMIDDLAPLQIFLLNPGDEVVAVANSVAFRWDGTDADLPHGTHGAIERCIDELDGGVPPNTLCLIQAIVREGFSGRGVAGFLISKTWENARSSGIERMVSPIRPTLKARYPITPMSRYVAWRRGDGEHFDPWIRSQERSGGVLGRVDDDSLVIRGTVAEWEAWTGMAFPESGEYVIPGGLTTLHVSRDDHRGRYAEEHVWMRYGES